MRSVQPSCCTVSASSYAAPSPFFELNHAKLNKHVEGKIWEFRMETWGKIANYNFGGSKKKGEKSSPSYRYRALEHNLPYQTGQRYKILHMVKYPVLRHCCLWYFSSIVNSDCWENSRLCKLWVSLPLCKLFACYWYLESRDSLEFQGIRVKYPLYF